MKGKPTLKWKRFIEERIIPILKESELGVRSQDMRRKHGITEPTFYRRRSRYGGFQVSETKTLNDMPTLIVINCTTTNDDRNAVRKYE